MKIENYILGESKDGFYWAVYFVEKKTEDLTTSEFPRLVATGDKKFKTRLEAWKII